MTFPSRTLAAAIPATLATLCLANSLNAALIDRYTFDNPVPGNAAMEADLGTDNTPINLFNSATRVADPAYPGAGLALRTGPVADPPTNNDLKAGILFPNSAASTLVSSANVTGITLMGWFKPLSAPNGTTSMIGLLRGDSTGIDPTAHDGRALIEMESSGGQLHLTALGRRLDSETTARPVLVTTDIIANILPTNQWTQIAATFDFDHGTMALYRDGVLLAGNSPSFTDWALTSGTDRTSNTAADALKIGGQLDDDTTPFDGLIDDVRGLQRNPSPPPAAPTASSRYYQGANRPRARARS